MAAAVAHGMHRLEVDYVWPTRITRPSYDVKLVYLDLNQWIGLAKAGTGHKDGARHLPALEAARAAKSAGTAIFPLSGTHYMELAGIGSYRHRCDVADVMEELSDSPQRAFLAGYDTQGHKVGYRTSAYFRVRPTDRLPEAQ